MSDTGGGPNDAIRCRRRRFVPVALPHGMHHAYALTLVVDTRVPLPAAQALVSHASVRTTAAYAKTDLSQLREFVELGFVPPAPDWQVATATRSRPCPCSRGSRLHHLAVLPRRVCFAAQP